MPFWLLILLFIGTTVVSMLLAPKPGNAKASGLGDFQAPTATEGRVIPVAFGTVKLAGPNVVWYGDLQAIPIRRKSGLFTHAIVGYKYYLGMDLIMCHGPIDALVDLYFGTSPDDTKATTYSVTESDANHQTRSVFQPEMFGGEDKEGGVFGEFACWFGKSPQPADAYLASVLGGSNPEYSGVCRIVVRHPYLGTSQYLKNISATVRRCPSNLGLSSGVTNINGDANPAEIIFDCMTNTDWGLGIPSARFDLTSFQACANTLKDEGFGLSMVIDNAQACGDFIGEVCRHVDSVVFTDPATGLWTMKLARNDYVITDLLSIGPDDISEKPEFSRGSWSETLNEIKINFISRTNYKEKLAQAHESANLAVTGEVASETLEFKGISNATQAQAVAMRELKTHSYPIARVRLTVNRKAWQMRVGTPFVYTYPPDGVTSMVMRATSISYGNLAEGKIVVEAVEDVFAVAYSAFDDPGDTGWTDPATASLPPDAELAFETPYQMLPTTTAETRVLVGCSRDEGVSLGYQVWADEGSGYFETNLIEFFCPSGTLTANYLRTTAALDATGFTVTAGQDFVLLVGTDAAGRERGDCLLLFEDTGEICAYQGVTDNGDGTWTFTNIVRGVFDTLPADHVLGTRVFFIVDNGIRLVADYKDDQIMGGVDDGFLVNGQ